MFLLSDVSKTIYLSKLNPLNMAIEITILSIKGICTNNVSRAHVLITNIMNKY